MLSHLLLILPILSNIFFVLFLTSLVPGDPLTRGLFLLYFGTGHLLGWLHTVTLEFASADVLPFFWVGVLFSESYPYLPLSWFIACFGGYHSPLVKWGQKGGLSVEIMVMTALSVVVVCSSDLVGCLVCPGFRFIMIPESPFTSLLFYGSCGFLVYSLVFMEHIHLWFIEERHIGGKLFEMHMSENNLIPPSRLIDGLDMEMWIGNQFPLELWRHLSLVFLLPCCCSQGWDHFLIFEHAPHCTAVKIQNYSITTKISLMLPL